MDKYKLSKIRFVFISRMTEARYFESIREDIVRQFRYSIIIGLVIFWLYSILDIYLLNENKTLNFLFAKIIPSISSVIMLIFIKKIKSYQKFYFFVFLDLILLLSSAVYIFINDPASPLEMAMTQFVFIMGTTLIIPNIFLYSMIISLVSSSIFCIIDISNLETTLTSLVIIISSFFVLNLFAFYTLGKSHLESRLKFRELVKEQK